MRPGECIPVAEKTGLILVLGPWVLGIACTQLVDWPRCPQQELTESLLVQDMEDIIVKMKALKSMGVGVSLDDFGTGYSCLNYLKHLPLDQLKIDQSFVRDVLTDAHDASIARMVLALGKNLGFNVVAEGVESQAQCDFLVQNDRHLFQGYLFSKPVSTAQDLDNVATQNTGSESLNYMAPLFAQYCFHAQIFRLARNPHWMAKKSAICPPARHQPDGCCGCRWCAPEPGAGQ